jgi:ceramide glucosyltransferase
VIAAAIFGALACLSFILLVWQFLCALRFPLHRRMANPGYSPDISILKPLKGADAHTRACLETWITQRYPGRVQILFGVHSPDDPVCSLVRDLILAHPAADAKLVICPKMLGPNAKVSTLVHLQSLASYEVVAVSDADIRVADDFLVQAVAPLQNNEAALANCFYEWKAGSGASLPMRWEAFAVNCDFWSQVLQARTLKPLDFALGAVMITTMQRLRNIGGFESLVDYLADDYQLGNRIAKSGGRIVIATVVVESWSPMMTAGEVWRHQLRWARTIRVCQPLPYFFSILNDVTLWSVLYLAANPPMWPWVGLSIFVRGATAMLIERKLTRRVNILAAPLALYSDLVRPFIWALAFLGNTVTWRGEKFRVQRGGKLVPLSNL